MSIIKIELNKENVEKQTAQNMVKAGVITPDECPHFINLLRAMSVRDLIIALLESWQFKERATNPIDFYPVIPEDICLN